MLMKKEKSQKVKIMRWLYKFEVDDMQWDILYTHIHLLDFILATLFYSSLWEWFMKKLKNKKKKSG